MKKLINAHDATRLSLVAENHRLREELEIANETLNAIRSGEIDALVVNGPSGEQVFTLKSADLPYRILVETMSEGAATLSSSGDILYCNQRFSEMMGGSRETILGSSILSFLSTEAHSAFQITFEKALKENAQCTIDVGPKDSSRIPAIFSMSSVQLESGQGVCLVATDLTKQLRLDEARSSILKLNLERDLRENFVATLSHDLRNPLTAAKVSAQMIVRYPDQHEKHQILGNRIVNGIERADMMIQDLLDANRIRAGEKLPLSIAQCDLKQTAEEMVNELAMTVGDRLILEAPPLLVGYWSGDQLRRLMENLAINAIKYGAKESPVLIRLESDATQIKISVHNEGTPLSAAEKTQLFDPFYRAKSASESGQKGWGLGLTLVRGVAEAHGGQVRVESSEEAGTTFLVEIPQDSRPYQTHR